MKKFLISIFVLFAFFGMIGTVEAEIVREADFTCDGSDYQCISCSYGSDYRTTYYVKADGSGNASVTFMTEAEHYSSYMRYTFNSSATSSDFYDESQGKLICPNTIYYSINGGGTNIIYNMSFSEDDDHNATGEIVSQEDNGQEYLNGSLENEPIRCSVPAINVMDNNQYFDWDATVIVDGNGNVSFEVNSEYEPGTIDGRINASLFQDGCPDNLLVSCGGNGTTNICTLDFDDFGNPGGGGGIFNPSSLCENVENCNISVRELCNDPGISNTLRSIGIIVVILKILVPAIIIVIGIKNLFQIIMSGKEDEVKKHVKSIVIRVIIGVVIFLLPGIITFVFDIATDVVDASGGDGGAFDNCWNCVMNVDECNS